MLRKTYTANIVRDGEIRGCVVATCWFWVSAYKIWDDINEFANKNNAKPCDFRRVK